MFPSRWKVELIRTIMKSPDKPPEEAKSYRPICLLSVLGKALERLIARRLSTVFLSQDYCSDRQYEFRPERSTENALVKFRELRSGHFRSIRQCLVAEHTQEIEGAKLPPKSL